MELQELIKDGYDRIWQVLERTLNELAQDDLNRQSSE